MDVYRPKGASALDRRKDEIAERLRAAVVYEAAAHPVKETARDAALTPSRVKQIRAGDAATISAPSLILLAQQRPALRSLLVELLHAELGETDRSPAQILDAIARLVRG